jgi:beta-lactamase superfamily II metal-dependent hydrolase
VIERIFHPIGQGAFYSEKHENFNIVYDCGNWKNTKLSSNVVKQAFNEGEIIDVLFISHFDYDHVNKIKILKEHAKIKRVVLPLLHNTEKNLLLNIHRSLKLNILRIIQNPEKFFGNDTQIIRVNYTDNNETPLGEDMPFQDIDELTSSTIESGTELRKSFNEYDWIYIPYNYCYCERNKRLETLIRNNGLDFEKFIKDPKYTINKTVRNRKELKDIYSRLSGNINQNSMLLYSGPHNNSNKCEYKDNLYYRHTSCYSKPKDLSDNAVSKCYARKNSIACKRRVAIGCGRKPSVICGRRNPVGCYRRKAVGCIYTGDCDLNVANIKEIFNTFWEQVSTIQIPHHGDIKSYNTEILNDKNYLCPISVGEKNRYKHPSKEVTSDILEQESCPFLVTEDLKSFYIEQIQCKRNSQQKAFK